MASALALNIAKYSILVYGLMMFSFGAYQLYNRISDPYIYYFVFFGCLAFYGFYVASKNTKYISLIMYVILGLHFMGMAIFEFTEVRSYKAL